MRGTAREPEVGRAAHGVRHVLQVVLVEQGRQLRASCSTPVRARGERDARRRSARCRRIGFKSLMVLPACGSAFVDRDVLGVFVSGR
jgi:hypothetical protein